MSLANYVLSKNPISSYEEFKVIFLDTSYNGCLLRPISKDFKIEVFNSTKNLWLSADSGWSDMPTLPVVKIRIAQEDFSVGKLNFEVINKVKNSEIESVPGVMVYSNKLVQSYVSSLNKSISYPSEQIVKSSATVDKSSDPIVSYSNDPRNSILAYTVFSLVVISMLSWIVVKYLSAKIHKMDPGSTCHESNIFSIINTGESN
jgi:hypothetical protein